MVATDMLKFLCRCSTAVLLIVGADVCVCVAADSDAGSVTTTTLEYVGSFDGVSPLKAPIMFRSDATKKPLIVCMHGFSENAARYTVSNRYLAEDGWFVVCVEMRGRGGSAGKFDSGGLEIHDIFDAVDTLLKRYPDEIDPTRIGIQGWSGGGGNVTGAMVRLPETFNMGASFFGIPDYGRWQRILDETQPDYGGPARVLNADVDEHPDLYVVRDFKRAVINCRAAKLFLYNDVEEATCLPDMDQAFHAAGVRAGLRNITLSLSKPGDPVRFMHGKDWPHLYQENPTFLTPFKNGRWPSPRLADEGELVVLGFVITDRFRIYCGDGQNAAAHVSYHMTEDEFVFDCKSITSDVAAPIELRLPVSTASRVDTAIVDGNKVELERCEGSIIVRASQLNCCIRVEGHLAAMPQVGPQSSGSP